MALGITSKKSNIKRSLDKYVYDNLDVDGEGLNIDYEGVPFESTGKAEWIQYRPMFVPGDFMRQGSSTEYANDSSLLANFNVFVQKSGVTVSDKHYKVRDWVANYFKIGQSIGIYDYVSGATTATSYMTVREVETDTVVPNDSFYQYNFTVVIGWTEMVPNP